MTPTRMRSSFWGESGDRANAIRPYTLHPTPHTLHPTPYTSGCGVWGVGCRETSCYFTTAVGGSKVLQGRRFRD
ncbi:MAG: hypothetical protein F6J93_12290 [Oscillatoria sp. SIO1A7]|nr:hypothetical protein [Oscillatoria sp. SIO1A7]